MEPSKKELIKQAQDLADAFEEKKSLINTALQDLDSREKITEHHIRGMAVIDEIFEELDKIKSEQDAIFDKIRKM
jgi:hypothetical protein